MNKLLFIINPVAGGGVANSLEPAIKEAMEKHNIEYDILFTTKPKEAIKIVENSPHEFVIAVGGDGTVNEVAKGLINRRSGVLGIIPGGTGNDLSRSLGISLDPLEAIQSIIDKNIKLIDVGMVNEHQFLNIASFGFDAEVVKVTNKIKSKAKGKLAYVLGVLIMLIKFKKREIMLKIDGKEYKENLVLLAAGNGKYYGGGMKILPQAELEDGSLHLCLIKDINNLFMLILFPTIFRGTHFKFKKYVSMYKAQNIKIESSKEIYFNLDGEIIYGGKTLNFKLFDYKLPIIYSQ